MWSLGLAPSKPVCIWQWYSSVVLVFPIPGKIRFFNPAYLLGLFKLTSLILHDGEQQAQSSAAPKKQPAGVSASREGLGANTWEQAQALCHGPLCVQWAAREVDPEGGVGSLGTAAARLLRNDYFCFVIGIIYTPFVLSALRQIHSRSLCNDRGRARLSQG